MPQRHSQLRSENDLVRISYAEGQGYSCMIGMWFTTAAEREGSCHLRSFGAVGPVGVCIASYGGVTRGEGRAALCLWPGRSPEARARASGRTRSVTYMAFVPRFDASCQLIDA